MNQTYYHPTQSFLTKEIGLKLHPLGFCVIPLESREHYQVWHVHEIKLNQFSFVLVLYKDGTWKLTDRNFARVNQHPILDALARKAVGV